MVENATEGARPRRALPADDNDGRPALASQEKDEASPFTPRARRAYEDVGADERPDPAEEHDTPPPGPGSAEADAGARTTSRRRPALVVAAAGLAVAVLIAVIYLSKGPSTSAGPASPSPSPSLSVASPSSEPSNSPAQSTDLSSPSGSALATNSKPPSPVGNMALDLNDARVTIPSGWELYADEAVDDSRRLLRLRDPHTDIRAQLVTLTSIDENLNAACQALVDDQSRAYEDVTPALTSPIGLNSDAGSGVTCGFTGTRASDGQSNSVTFTIVQRGEDDHSLVLRSTIPATVVADDPGRAALVALNCEASSTFGLPLPLC